MNNVTIDKTKSKQWYEYDPNTKDLDDGSSVQSDESIDGKAVYDINEIISPQLENNVINSTSPLMETSDAETVKDYLTIIHEIIKDISANTMLNLMTPTNNDPTDANIYSHEIVVTEPGTEPIKQKSRKVPFNFANEFKAIIDEILAAGMIVGSKSPWCSPVRLVKKRDNSIRICIDFRKVNNVTVKDAYPIPIINDIFVHLSKAKVFSTIDLKNGYYQVRMEESSQEMTAFACQFGFFEYRVMPMGLTNSGATFQRLMNHVLKDLIGKICLVYLDDIIIYSNTAAEHLEHLKIVCEALRKYNWKISRKKCSFFQTRIPISHHRRWPIVTKSKENRSDCEY